MRALERKHFLRVVIGLTALVALWRRGPQTPGTGTVDRGTTRVAGLTLQADERAVPHRSQKV